MGGGQGREAELGCVAECPGPKRREAAGKLLPEKLASGLVPASEPGTLPPEGPWANGPGSPKSPALGKPNPRGEN